MKTRLTRASDRGLKDIGWLKSHLSLSFGPYPDPERSGFGDRKSTRLNSSHSS